MVGFPCGFPLHQAEKRALQNRKPRRWLTQRKPPRSQKMGKVTIVVGKIPTLVSASFPNPISWAPMVPRKACAYATCSPRGLGGPASVPVSSVHIHGHSRPKFRPLRLTMPCFIMRWGYGSQAVLTLHKQWERSRPGRKSEQWEHHLSCCLDVSLEPGHAGNAVRPHYGIWQGEVVQANNGPHQRTQAWIGTDTGSGTGGATGTCLDWNAPGRFPLEDETGHPFFPHGRSPICEMHG